MNTKELLGTAPAVTTTPTRPGLRGGTTTRMLSPFGLQPAPEMVATCPPKLTLPFPCADPKLFPVIVTRVPGDPDAAKTPVITGGFRRHAADGSTICVHFG